MIRITCCRLGRFPRNNIEKKGTFIKEFDNMQQLAVFVRGSFKSLFFPKIKEELNRKQHRELVGKLQSLERKKKIRAISSSGRA